MTLLRVEQLQAGYGPAQVLYDVRFEIDEGEVVTLLGRNMFSAHHPVVAAESEFRFVLELPQGSRGACPHLRFSGDAFHCPARGLRSLPAVWHRLLGLLNA